MNDSPPPNQVVQLTPPGRGAVAVLRVSGPGATQAVERWFWRPRGARLGDQPLGRILYGRWGGEQGEEIVVCRREAEVVEVHCHGGAAAVHAISAALQATRCESADWRDVVEPNRDPIQTAARQALAEAVTERTAAILLDQYNGALRETLDRVAGHLTRGDVEPAQAALAELLERSRLGLRLTQPWRIGLAGRPNVGKSSLMNALLGYERSIVHDLPGVTRDVVTAAAAIDGWPVQLEDLAGLRATQDELESLGVERAYARLAAVDLVLLVCDRSVPWSELDHELLARWPGALVVHNKSDLPAASGHPPGIPVSALTRQGVNDLLQAIAQRLVPDVPPPFAAVPFTTEQVAAIEAAAGALTSGDIEQAIAVIRLEATGIQ